MENSPKIEDTTQVNPFKQPKFKNQAIFRIFSFFVFWLRFPFFIILFAFFFINTILISVIPKTKITRVFLRLFSYLFYKFIFIFTGTYTVNVQPTPLVDRYRDAMPFISPKAGDLIISNLGSFLNLFYIQGNFLPIYAVPYDREFVLKKNFMSLLIDHIFSRNFRSGGTKVKLSTLLEEGKNKFYSPVCIFPEAAPTNCTALLKFQTFGIGLELENVNVSVIGFLNTSVGICADFPLGISKFWYIIGMFGRLIGVMKVRTALPQDIPKVPENGIDEKWINDCRTLMAAIMRIPLSSYSVFDYIELLPK